LSVHVEHLENHRLRLTVDVAQDRMNAAMEKAAAKIGRQINIPGFRKGKAPFKVILRYVGQQALMEEALEDLGNVVYGDALRETNVAPYAPGTMENVNPEPLQFVYTLPKQPEAQIGDYRNVRIPYEVATVGDTEVDAELERLRNQFATTETVARPTEMGDMMKVKINGMMTHDHDHDHDHEDGETHEGDEAHEHDHSDAPLVAEPFIDEDDFQISLQTEGENSFLPGFAKEVVGLSVGDSKTVTMVYPEDYEDSEVAGHTFTVDLTVKEVQARNLPALDDAFALKASKDAIATLADYRADVQKRLQEAAITEANQKYSDKMLDSIVAISQVAYPEEAVGDYVDNILQSMDNNLRQQNLSLSQLMTFQGKTVDDLRKDYRPAGIERLKRSVVIRHLLDYEGLMVTPEEIDAQLDEMAGQISKDASQVKAFREMLNRDQTKQSIAYDMMISRLGKQLLAIGKGENPNKGETAKPHTPAEGEASDSSQQ
jgi:trigger factor